MLPHIFYIFLYSPSYSLLTWPRSFNLTLSPLILLSLDIFCLYGFPFSFLVGLLLFFPFLFQLQFVSCFYLLIAFHFRGLFHHYYQPYICVSLGNTQTFILLSTFLLILFICFFVPSLTFLSSLMRFMIFLNSFFLVFI